MSGSDAIGTRRKPWTPYRRGYAAGEAFAAEFRAWRDTPLADRGRSPERPSPPYTRDRSVLAWREGFLRAVGLHA